MYFKPPKDATDTWEDKVLLERMGFVEIYIVFVTVLFASMKPECPKLCYKTDAGCLFKYRCEYKG